jgi:hypothetical protein
MRQVNQPEVLPNRSLKTGEIRKSLVRNTLLMRGQHVGRRCFGPRTQVSLWRNRTEKDRLASNFLRSGLVKSAADE